jgi:hypothetical protein
MQLVQLLLPVFDADGQAFPSTYYDSLKKQLTEQFGGVTAYTRSPAKGFWKENDETTVKDDIIIFEVMTETLDRGWWSALRIRLEEDFQQDELIIRTWQVELL